MKRVYCGFIIICLFTISFAALIKAKADRPIQEMTLQSVPRLTITKNNTRVTLLHVAKTTSFPNSYVNGEDEDGTNTYVIPGSYVVYLVECLGDDEIRNTNTLSPVQLWRNGHKLTAMEPVARGGANKKESYSSANMFGYDMPQVENESRSFIRKASLRGVAIPSETVDIKIRVGFNQESALFEFNGVPIY
jgi:hypothetical protein